MKTSESRQRAAIAGIAGCLMGGFAAAVLGGLVGVSTDSTQLLSALGSTFGCIVAAGFTYRLKKPGNSNHAATERKPVAIDSSKQ